MPPRKKFQKKKNYRKKRYNQTLSLRSPVATKMVTKLKYFGQADINPTAAVTGVHVFSANGMFDVDISGTGHQPRGFDQLMLLYDHYVVLGSKITVRFDNQANLQPALVGIAVRDISGTSGDVESYLEQAYNKVCLMKGGSEGVCSLSLNCNPNKFLSRSHPLADPELKGSSLANPTEQCYFHVFANDTDSLTNLNIIHAQVSIEYIVALIEPKVPPLS